MFANRGNKQDHGHEMFAMTPESVKHKRKLFSFLPGNSKKPDMNAKPVDMNAKPTSNSTTPRPLSPTDRMMTEEEENQRLAMDSSPRKSPNKFKMHLTKHKDNLVAYEKKDDRPSYRFEDGRKTKLEFRKMHTIEKATTIAAFIGAALTVIVVWILNSIVDCLLTCNYSMIQN